MSSNATMGIVFCAVGLAATFLMYHLWGYPYDKATRTSKAPRSAMLAHRLLGYLFAALYIGLMVRMVPRMWQYQVEFPARTTVDIVVAFTVDGRPRS
jgi:EamA domain-containing membrane protein RarD